MKATGSKLIVVLKHKDTIFYYDSDTGRYYKENERGESRELSEYEFKLFETSLRASQNVSN